MSNCAAACLEGSRESRNYPLISIVTVCRNAGNTIARTFQGLRDQTYPNIEYIVIDGGSTDGTVERIASDSDLISCYVSEKDNGIYDAMNKGIRIARGEIIGIINADDYYEPTALEEVMRAWQKDNSLDVIYGNCEVVNFGESVVRTSKPQLDFKKGVINIPHPSAFVSKRCYTNHGLFDDSYLYGGDYELFCRLASRGAKFRYIDKTLAYFRLGGFSASVGIAKEKELLLTTWKYWGFLAACKVFPGKCCYPFVRRKLGSCLRNLGLKRAV
ncbi:MAG: glycosyltransferase family 2 protein [Rhodocyclales bacterium]|nr:glycosyltransferase family 2 protein [Rhodocyclales bacterium]